MALNEAELNLIKYLGISEADFGNMSKADLKKKTTEKLIKIIEERSSGERKECLENAQKEAPKIKGLLQGDLLVHYRKKAATGEKTTYPVGKVIGFSNGEYLLVSPTAKPAKQSEKAKRPTIIYVAEGDIIAKSEDMKK